MSLKQMLQMHAELPEEQMLWSGIKQGSFGFVFGPPKSGKTIFSENLAMNIAAGRVSFLNEKLSYQNPKVLFISLEEFWRSRSTRHLAQLGVFNEDELKLIDQNYHVQVLDFPRYINSKEEFNQLRNIMVNSGAGLVVVDSLTHFGSGQIEDSKIAKEIVMPLRDLTYEIGVTTLMIHHSTKNIGNIISMDSMAGSRVLAQEADFMLGIAKTQDNLRYLRKVAFRHASDDFDTVTAFSLNDNCILNLEGEISIQDVVSRNDGRFGSNSKELLYDYIQNHTGPVSTHAVVSFATESGISERTAKEHLKKMTEEGVLNQPMRGQYSFNLTNNGADL